MKANFNGTIFDIDTRSGKIFIDGNELPEISGGNHEFTATIDGKKLNIFTASDKKHYYCCVDGTYFTFDKIDEDESDFAAAGNSGNREDIIPPMPGSVVKIIAEKGKSVNEGDPLIVVEAMKMETTLYASISGEVTAINVEEKQQVDSDTILITIEKPE
jgi:biotin carboxyl carrier protein